MTELILHMNNYSITEAITGLQRTKCTLSVHMHTRVYVRALKPCIHMHGHASTVRVPKTM